MASLNKVLLIGNLVRDPEAKATPDGTSISQFSVATNMRWTDKSGATQEKAEFHNIVAWRKLAEICNQYLKKGSKVYLEGRLQTRSWDDATGNKRYRTEVVLENMIMLDRPGGSSASGMARSGDQSTNQSGQFQEKTVQIETEPISQEINPDDIPF